MGDRTINSARRAAGLPEAETAEEWAAREAVRSTPRAEQPSMGQEEAVEFLRRQAIERMRESEAGPLVEPQAYREMTPDEIRAAELAMLLDFVQGDPIDGIPSPDEVISGIKHRISELTPQAEAPQAEQPSNPAARLSSAIASEARDLSFEDRMQFLTGLIEAITEIVRDTSGQDIVGWVRSGELPEIPEVDPGVPLTSTLEAKLNEVEQRIVLPAAVEFLNDHSDDIEPEIRRELVTVVAARITERLARID